MDCRETLTGTGRARWGNRDVDIALSTIARTWHTRDGTSSQTAEAFRLTFVLLTPQRWGPSWREFKTEERRRLFIEAGISDWREHSASGSLLRGCTPRYATWRMQTVRSAQVEPQSKNVVLDLDTDQVRLELLPEVRLPDRSLSEDDPEYGMTIAALTGQQIADVDLFLDDGLVLTFPSVSLVLRTERLWAYDWPQEIEWAIGGDFPRPIEDPGSRDIREH